MEQKLLNLYVTCALIFFSRLQCTPAGFLRNINPIFRREKQHLSEVDSLFTGTTDVGITLEDELAFPSIPSLSNRDRTSLFCTFSPCAEKLLCSFIILYHHQRPVLTLSCI